jgi:hypothetical protein
MDLCRAGLHFGSIFDVKVTGQYPSTDDGIYPVMFLGGPVRGAHRNDCRFPPGAAYSGPGGVS